MVRLVTFFLALPLLLCSGEFTASVNHNPVTVGESFTLNLSLKDASAKGSPSLGALGKAFFINSQQQLSNTRIINGRMTSSLTWKISLTAQREGEEVIPAITINTSEGPLSTTPIQIQVVKSSRSDTTKNESVAVVTKLSKQHPYKNEPVVLTIQLSSKVELADVKMQPIVLEDALVESLGKPKIYQKVIEGKRVNLYDFNFLVTPLKAGVLQIASHPIQVEIPVSKNVQHRNSFFDDMDPFFGFAELQPLHLATKETSLDVQAPVADVNPWLPLTSLKIEETWDNSQTLQVGEPLTRSFKISAEGTTAHQLPSLNDLQIQDNTFKIYADKPETKEDYKNGKVQSLRKEHYTLIPQQAGALQLPEITIPWWNVATHQKELATIPARTLHILPAVETKAPSPEEPTVQVPPKDPAKDPLVYQLLAGLGLLLCGALVWIVLLQRKIRQMQTPKPTKPVVVETKPAKEKKNKLRDLNPT